MITCIHIYIYIYIHIQCILTRSHWVSSPRGATVCEAGPCKSPKLGAYEPRVGLAALKRTTNSCLPTRVFIVLSQSRFLVSFFLESFAVLQPQACPAKGQSSPGRGPLSRIELSNQEDIILNSYRATGTRTWKHLKSKVKHIFLIVSLRLNIYIHFLG